MASIKGPSSAGFRQRIFRLNDEGYDRARDRLRREYGSTNMSELVRVLLEGFSQGHYELPKASVKLDWEEK